MESRRREFLKLTGLTWLGMTTGGLLQGFAAALRDQDQGVTKLSNSKDFSTVENENFNEKGVSLIGLYGKWAGGFNENKLPAFSFRRKEWPDLEPWRKAAKRRANERLAIPDIAGTPKVNITR